MREQLNTHKNQCSPVLRITPILFLLLMSSLSWGTVDAILGDVNKDGKIDILDIQNGINIAIGLGEHVPMADANQNNMVDILDVQILINTVLGVGGLVQPVEGNVPLEQGANLSGNTGTVVALSDDGRIVSTEISGSNGNFRMLLPIGASWTLAIMRPSISGGNSTASTFITAPIGQQNMLSIPLTQLSTGKTLLLGTLNLQQANIILPDIRHLLGSIAEPLPATDENNNQIPDIYEQFINQFKAELLAVPYLQSLGFNETLFNGLIQNLATCIQPYLDTLLTPSLNGIERNGYPEMVQPLIQCFAQMLKSYLAQVGIPGIESLVDTVMNQLQQELQQQVREWLNSLDVPEVTDTNGNNIPDFIEAYLCSGTGCVFDSNGNRIPDFIEDNDLDGIPNYLDPDNQTETDTDGDGIPNDLDIDANGNGILDYAENKE
ncbi:MAG: hypothetical protein LDL53_11375 [Candidatus Hydrogenedens sp.]|nr:hypothetical protein [Candidatus Hydrogenedens sp.]